MADENDDNNVISAEDFAAAIAKMREHPEWDSFYADAPEGARMFLGLRFYLEAFGEKANRSQYETCLQEIEPELSLEDISYLLRRNWSADVMGYLHDRMMKIPVPKKRANRAERPVLPPHANESAKRRSEARTLRKQTQQAKAAEQEARRQEAAGKSPKRTTWRRNINGEIIAPDSYAGKTSWWREKDAQDEARRRKAETRAMREAIDDERFERDNAVNNEKIEAILNSGEIVCRPER